MTPALTTMIRSEIGESARVQQHLAGQDISDAPLWHVEGVPTYRGALVASKALGIERLRDDLTSSVCGTQRAYHAVMWCRRGNAVRVGAATSRVQAVAKELAFRNAVRHLL